MQATYWSSVLGGHIGVSLYPIPTPRLHVRKRQRTTSRSTVMAFGSGKQNEETIQGYVQPASPPNAFMSSPWYMKAPVAILGLIAVLRIVKAFRNRDRG